MVLKRRAKEFDDHLVSFIFTGTSPGLLDSLSKCAVCARVSVCVVDYTFIVENMASIHSATDTCKD